MFSVCAEEVSIGCDRPPYICCRNMGCLQGRTVHAEQGNIFGWRISHIHNTHRAFLQCGLSYPWHNGTVWWTCLTFRALIGPFCSLDTLVLGKPIFVAECFLHLLQLQYPPPLRGVPSTHHVQVSSFWSHTVAGLSFPYPLHIAKGFLHWRLCVS